MWNVLPLMFFNLFQTIAENSEHNARLWRDIHFYLYVLYISRKTAKHGNQLRIRNAHALFVSTAFMSVRVCVCDVHVQLTNNAALTFRNSREYLLKKKPVAPGARKAAKDVLFITTNKLYVTPTLHSNAMAFAMRGLS